MNDAPRIEELLVVGRRVRVQRSPECQYVSHDRPDISDGLIGIIDDVNFHPLFEGHAYRVHYDNRLWGPDLEYGWRAESCSASELIPLADNGSEILHPALARFER